MADLNSYINIGANSVQAVVVSASGNITGNYLFGNGSQLNGLPATYSDSNVTTLLAAYGSNTVSTTGNITTGNLRTAGNVTFTANTGNLVFNTGAYISGNANSINRDGSLILQPAGTGTFQGVVIGGAGRLLAPSGSVHQIFNANDVTFQVAAKVITGTVSTSTTTGALQITGGGGFTGNVYAGNVYTPGLASVTGNATAGNVLTAGIMSSTGNATHGNILTAGLISAGGNVTAQNFIGNISITGNVTGTSPNVSLVAGSYTYTFDNTGILTLPAPPTGNEGGEIDFTKAGNSSLSGNTVVLDQYVDRFRFFESGGNSRGAYIDLTQAANGVGTLLNNRVSGFADAGSFITMDNIKATVTTSGNRGLSLATVTGTFTYSIAGNYAVVGGATGGTALFTQTATTSASSSIFGWNFPNTAETSTYILTDITNNRCYRITLMIGAGYSNNSIIIERLI